MKIEPFRLERYFARHEFLAPYLLACSDCESLAVGELLQMEPGADKAFNALWLGYTESQGHPQLREKIAALYNGITPDQVLVHTGAEEAIFIFMQVALQKGDHVIVHYPCYQSLVAVARAIGCEVTLWEATDKNGWALDVDFVKKNVRPNTRLVIVNFPHNPTGYLMPKADFKELVSLSAKNGFTIFSDEVYRFLEYNPQDRLPAVCSMDDQGVSLGVMSKAWGLAGLRIGWIATRNRKLLAAQAAYKDYTTICSSAPSEFLASVALKHKERLVDRNLKIVRRNLVQVETFFEHHADLFAWQSPKAGPIAFPRWIQGDVENFCRDLRERFGVLLLPGTLYDPGSAHFRIGFGRADLSQGLKRFEEYLQERRCRVI
jgi:aspartate/methionine/tyrosine aminotransferase